MPIPYEQRKSLTLGALEKLKSLQTEPLSEIEKIAASKLSVLLRHSKVSSWWRQHLAQGYSGLARGKNPGELLIDLPLLDRMKVQQNLNWMRIWVPGSRPEDYVELSTSGSTGEPVRVKQYLPAYQVHYGAIELFDALWHKRDLSRNLGFFRISQSEKIERKLGEPFVFLGATGNLISKKIVGTTPRELLEVLVKYDAPYLSVNGMVQRLLAQEQISNPVPGIKLEQLLNWADPVSPELRNLVREAFGARIIDRYSSNEFGYLATQCPKDDHLHALQINNYIEILDESNERVRPGQPGRVVVTALNNFSQPLIRYELGDIATWGDGCSAGITFPIIQPTIVRQREIHFDQDGVLRVPHPDSVGIIKSGKVGRFQIFRFNDSIVLFAHLLLELSQQEIQTALDEIRNQFGLESKYLFIALPSNLAQEVVPWKMKRVIKISQPTPENLDANTLIKLLSSN